MFDFITWVGITMGRHKITVTAWEDTEAPKEDDARGHAWRHDAPLLQPGFRAAAAPALGAQRINMWNK